MTLRSDSPPPPQQEAAVGQAHLLILTADRVHRLLPVHKPGLTIGSKPDNDIVLTDPQVANYHARIEHEGDRYQVIDLNSITGTFVGDTPLRPGIPTEWTPEEALRIGENWIALRLTAPAPEAAEPLPEPAAPQPAPAPPEFDPALIQWSAGKQLGVYLSLGQITLAPGKSASVPLVLFNHAAEVDHFSLTTSGLAPNWIGALPSQITVPAGTERQINLVFQLPDSPAARAGRYHVAIQATSQLQAEEQVEATLTLTVPAHSRFVSTLSPESLIPNEPAQVKIENLGNLPETYALTVEAPTDELKLELREGSLKIPEGQAAIVELRAAPRPKLWRSSVEIYPFSLHVQSASGQTQTHEAEVVSRLLVPAWLPPLALLAGLSLCVGFLLVFSSVTDGMVPPTLTPTSTGVSFDSDNDGLSNAEEARRGTNPAIVDTDGDTLWDGAEIRAGTNPLVIDTDGDTLSDGREVRELYTSPINSDTDGDGLNDNVDPDPGRLPTATPLPPTATAPPPPTNTSPPPPPTETPLPPTPTQVPPTPTAIPPSPTATAITVSGWIAFETRRDGNLEIYLMRADNRSELRLTNNTADDRHLVWAPAGNRLAFDSNRDGNSEIYVMNVDGSAQTRLTNDPARDFDPVWAPDSSRLAFLSDRDGSLDIYALGLDGAAPIRLTSAAANECCALWSPLGTLIAFMSDRENGWGLYRMNPDGLAQTRLAAAVAALPTWSPDGARLAFVSDRDGNNEIYAISSDGGGESRLTNHPAQDTNPVWAPNGSRIAFLSNRDGNPEVYVMGADGAAQTRLTDSPANECCLVWSPDGAQLAFVSDRDGNYEIYVIDVNSRGLARLTNNPAYDAPLAWRP